MNIIDITQELLDYLHSHNGNRRTCDAMEECLELLQSDLTEEQREREIKRVGETLTFLANQEQQRQEELASEEQKKKRFIEKNRGMVEECWRECRSMAQRKSMEQSHLVQGYENEFLTEMNVELNGSDMQGREKLMQLTERSRLRLSDSIRPIAKEFVGNVMEEFDECMEKVRKAFAETKIREFHQSHREMYESVMENYDSIQRQIQAEVETYVYPDEPFREFAEKTGSKMEAVGTRKNFGFFILKILPLIIIFVKYVAEHYIFPKETWMDKLVGILERWMENSSLTGTSMLRIVEVVLQFAQEHEETFTFSAEFILFFLFFGWLYYIYLKLVSNMKQKSLYRKQQAIMASAAKSFLQELKIGEEINRMLAGYERKIEEYYMQKHRSLFEKLVYSENGTDSENVLQKLQDAYSECTR